MVQIYNILFSTSFFCAELGMISADAPGSDLMLKARCGRITNENIHLKIRMIYLLMERNYRYMPSRHMDGEALPDAERLAFAVHIMMKI